MSTTDKEAVLRCTRIICQRNGPESPTPGQATFKEIHEAVRELVRPMKPGTLRSIIRALIQQGAVAPSRQKKRTYRAIALDRVTLEDLLREAEKQIDSTVRGTAERRATVAGSPEVEAISQRKWERIRTALRKLARSRHPELSLKEAMAQPASDLFHWSPDEGPGGEGDWRRLTRAMERASKPSTRSDDVSAIHTLADLSASHGWIRIASSPSGAENGNGSRLGSPAGRLRDEAHGLDPQIQGRRQVAQAVERLYQKATGQESAYVGMWTIFRSARRELLDRLGLAKSSELSDVSPEYIWKEAGKLLRDLVYYQDQLMVPLRALTSTLITMGMRDPDMGAYYPAGVFKVVANGDMEVRYSTPEGAGPYDLHLWHAYSQPGGVRELELARRGEATDAVYVAFGHEKLQVSRNADGEKMLTGRRHLFVWAVRRVLEAARLGGMELDPQFLIDEGVATTHPCRHAVATWLCAEGRLEEAAMLLRHSNLNMIRKVYSGPTTAVAGGEVIMSSMGEDE